MENGKEPGLGKDTFSRAEGKSRCMTGFGEVSEHSWRNTSDVQHPRAIWEAVGIRASHLGQPRSGHPVGDHQLGMSLRSSKIAPQVWGNWNGMRSCEK